MVEIVKLSQEEKDELEEIAKKLTEEEVKELIDMLFEKDNKSALQAILKLYYRSQYFDDVYSYFDTFIRLMNDDNSYKRSRGIFLISINAKWDKENKLNESIDEFLSHTEDEKSITSRQCIKSLENIIPYKKEFHEKIRDKLENINYNCYTDNMKDLIFRDVTQILELL